MAPAQATTLAYWRFDGDGVTTPSLNTWVTPTEGRTVVEVDPTFISGFDSSGNGNHLYTWNNDGSGHNYAPTFLNKTVANGSSPNNWQIVNNGGSPATFTWSDKSLPTGVNLETVTPAQWTVEATVKPTTVNGAFRTIVGRDGNGTFAGDPNLAPFYLQITNTNQFRIRYTDLAGNSHVVVSPSTVLVNQTYHVAATSNGSTLSLFVDQSNGAGYQLAGSISLAGSANTALGRDTVGSTTVGDTTFGWTVGRGRYGQADLQGDNHADRFLGFIDEVRISDAALTPAQLLFAGQNAPAGPAVSVNRTTGVISLTNLQAGQQVRSYTIDSASGALDVTKFFGVGTHTDSPANGGNGSFDNDGIWGVGNLIATQVTEGDLTTTGGTLGTGGATSVQIFNAGGWFKSPNEDLTASIVIFDPVLGDVTFGAPVLFTGNGGLAYRRSDLNFDGSINGLDWVIFRTNNRTAIDPGLTDPQSYALGDLNGDQINNFTDFRLFQADFVAVNSEAAFEALLASVPEPSSLMLAGLAMLAPTCLRRRRAARKETQEAAGQCDIQHDASQGVRTSLRIFKFVATTVAAVAIAAPIAGPVQAADITLATGDPAGTNSSFGPSASTTQPQVFRWSNGVAPSAGNTYQVGISPLRTPPDADSYTFAGDSLSINGPNGDLAYKGVGTTGITTINNLIMNGGLVRHISGVGDLFQLAGNVNIAANSRITARQGRIDISANISGSASITNEASDGVGRTLAFLSPSNTFTGNLINNGRFQLASTGVMNFNIGATGINNSISGTGAENLLDGTFNFNLTGASTTVGSSWNVVPATNKAFGATFNVAGFTPLTDSIWVNGNYTFSETTGVLNVGGPALLTLVINKNTGAAAIKNAGTTRITTDYYEINSLSSALNAANGSWNSLSDQNFDAGLSADFNNSGGAVNAADLTTWRGAYGPGNATGDADLDGDTDGNDFLAWQRQLGQSPGEGDSWDESGGVGDTLLAEFFLKSGSTFAPGQQVSLGTGAFRTSVFGPGNDGDLTFQYAIKGQNTLTTGIVQYVTTGPVTAVPEPTTLIGAVLAFVGLASCGRVRRCVA